MAPIVPIPLGKLLKCLIFPPHSNCRPSGEAVRYLMASICESKRLTMSLLLLAGCFCLSPIRKGLKLVADSVDRGSYRVLSEGPERRTSSNAGGGVDEEEGVEGTLRSSPTSSLPRGGRKDTTPPGKMEKRK